MRFIELTQERPTGTQQTNTLENLQTMEHIKFTEPSSLHNHSVYSLLDALPTPQEWVGWALETGTRGFAVTDHGTNMSMFHARRFPEYIKAYNVKHGTSHAPDAVVGIPGIELYVEGMNDPSSNYHITAWAVSNEGFANLTKLSSLAWNNVVHKFGNPKPRVTFEQIQQYKAGIKWGSGCVVGPIGSAIWRGDYVEAERMYLQYQLWFGDDLYIEFHPTSITHNYDRKTGGFSPIDECACGPDKQLAYNVFLKEMVIKHGGKCVPSTDAHMIKPEDKELQDLILKKGSGGWHFKEVYCAKLSEEIYAKLVEQLGQEWLTRERFQSWIENTYEVSDAAKSIDVTFPMSLPTIAIPQHISSEYATYDEQVKALMTEKAKLGGRWRNEPEYEARFETEVQVICHNPAMSFAPYYLLYNDICNFTWNIGEITGPGRGSGAGSLVAYYLNITHLDPVAEHLPFERFFSNERALNKKFPDFDIDISNREPVLNYLADKYGLGFSQICTYSTMKIKSAVYDAMSHLHGQKRNDPALHELCTNLPNAPTGLEEYKHVYGYTDKDGNFHAGLIETHPPLARFFAQYPDVEAMVRRLLGFISSVGRHPSAYVVATQDLEMGLTPTMTIKGIKATQFDAPMIEMQGLVKADLLGVKTLTAIAEAVRLIKNVDYLEKNEHGLPLLFRLPEDPAVYADLNALDVDSVFQFNTDLIKSYIKRFNPQSRQHLSALTALCRPGALDAIFVNDEITASDKITAVEYYIQVRNGKRQLRLLHPDLAVCTHNGIFVYQEDIKRFFEMVGFPPGEAEQIMAGVAKKKLSDIQKGFTKARELLPLRGWTPEQIETVLLQITAFAKYSFNRSHSRAYSDIGYQTAYLKHHHPLEWWTAMLNAENESDSTNKEDKIRQFISLLGDKIVGPTLAHTASRFTIRGNKIVAPLSVLKKIGDKAAEELIDKGPFTSLQDFVSRVDARRVNAGVFQALVRGRAADDLMDKGIDYGDARVKLLRDYMKLKKCKTIGEDMFNVTPLNVFLQERDTNTVFNKQLNSLFEGRFASVAEAEKSKRESSLVLQLVDKEKRSGISKAGNAYTIQKCTWSDGTQTVESVRFKEESFVGLPSGTICKVSGVVSRGFANKLQIAIDYAQQL